MDFISDINEKTPVVKVGDCWAKREDLFLLNGVRGAKCRAAAKVVEGATGIVTYGSRISSQGVYASGGAKAAGVPCVYVTAHGAVTPTMQKAIDNGAELVQVKPGYLSQCAATAKTIAKERGFRFVRLGMESKVAVDSICEQVVGAVPKRARRLVVVVGSGVTVSGILWGLVRCKVDIPVLGVTIGKDPIKLIRRWAPPGWDWQLELVPSGVPYAQGVENVWRNIVLDPHYEAKCVPFLRPYDLFWIVGIRPFVDTI